MKKIFNLILISVIGLLLFSCATTKVESPTKKNATYEELVEYTLSCTNKNSSYYFNEAMSMLPSNNIQGFDEVVAKWTKESPLDPDLYLARFIETLNLSIIPGTNIFDTPPSDGTPYEVVNKDGKDVYVTRNFQYDKEKIKLPIEILKEAITHHPLRIDLYHELITTYFNLGMWEEGVEYIYALFDLVPLSQNRWLWAHNIVEEHANIREEADIDFINVIHSLVYTLYNEEETDFAVEVDNLLCKTFPNNYMLLNAVAIDFYKIGLKEEALEYLNYAHKIAPGDYIIIGNLAAFNEDMGNQEEADKYINMLLSSGDEYWIEYASSLKTSN